MCASVLSSNLTAFPLTSYLPNTSPILPVTQNISVVARHRCGLPANFNKATLSNPVTSRANRRETRHPQPHTHTQGLFPAFKNSRAK